MRAAFLIPLILLLCAPASGVTPQQKKGAAQRSAYLHEGYYFELTPCVRCYRCAPCALPDGWQREVMLAFKRNGVRAFLAPPYQLNRARVKHVQTVGRVQGYNTSIYVGPYETEEGAAKDFRRVCELAADFPYECRDWPEKEYSIGFAKGIWAALDYVPGPEK